MKILQYLSSLFLVLLALGACNTSAYKVGQKYVYNYRLNTLQSLSSRNGAATWARLNLEVIPVSSTEEQLSLRFKISSISNQLGPFTEPTETSDPNYGLTGDFVGDYRKGKLEIKVNPTEGKSSIGLKKSIASLFNVQKVAGESAFASYEDSPVGSCDTVYSVTRGESPTSYNVTKTRNYENCTEEVALQGRKFSTPEFHKCTKSPEYSVTWISRSAFFTYNIEDGVVKGGESFETISFALFGHKSSSSIEIKGYLALESSTAATASELPGNLITVPVSGKSGLGKGKENFDSATVNLAEPSKYGMWPKQEVADLIKSMETLVSSIDSGMSSATLVNDNFTMDFIELQLSISRLSLTELQSLYSTIKSRSDGVPKLFLDALTFTSSNPVFSFFKSFVKNADPQEKYALRNYLQVIPFRELKVSKALLDGYLDLCKQTLGTGLETTCFFSLANVLQVHCSDSPVKKSDDSCNPKISITYYNKMIATIREIIPAGVDRDMLENGISNNVYNEESLKLLIDRISDPRLRVRRTATVALFGHRLDGKSTPTKTLIQNILFNKIMDRKEDHVVRIYAFLVYMKTAPSLSRFRAIARYISDPREDEQVAHYALSLMKMMKHTVNPCYAGFSLLSKYGIKEMRPIRDRFEHTTLALSTARVYESFDKDFGFGGSTVVSYILNKESPSASFYLEEKMVVNGYTGGHLAMLLETFPETKTNASAVSINPSTTGLDEKAAAIIQTMASIWNGTPKPAPVVNNDMRLSFMINGRVVDSIDPMQLQELVTLMKPSINKLMIDHQFYNYVSSEHGFMLFNLMVSGGGVFVRTGPLNINKKQSGDTMFQATLSPTLRRDIGAYTITGLKSPLTSSGRSGIMTSIQRTHRLPLNISYAITKKTAHLKFKMPTEPTDFILYRMNAYTFNDPKPIGSIRSTLKPLFTDYNGKPENDLVKGKTYWKGFLGNGLRMTTTINRPRSMDGLGYRYMLLEKSLYNDDVRLIRMKFEYGGVIVPIDWRLTLLPDPKVNELTFAFNRSISIDDVRSGEYQMTVLKNAETIISTRVSYTYTTDFLTHNLRLYYNNYLKNIHTCIKGDVFAPKVDYSRYTTIDNLANLEDKLHFNGSIYFDQSCSTKGIIVKGEFSPSEEQRDPKYTQLFSKSCGRYGLLTNKIPFCAGYHYHTSELRSVKIHVTHKDVPSYFWRYLTWFHNKGIQKYANQVKYRAITGNEVTDPSVTLVSANSTWFSPYKYNVSYKMVDREEFWENIPSTGLSWPNSFSLFDFHVYQAFHRTLREPYCYLQKSRVRTFDEYSTNVTIKPDCFKTLVMDCTTKDRFTVLYSQDADGKLETIEIYLASPATKLEISPKSNVIKSNGSPVDLTVKETGPKGYEVKDFGIYKRVSLNKERIKIYFDDVGILVKSSKMHFSQVCGLCGNMNSCHHDDHGPTHHHSHKHSESLWITKDDRNTAKGCQ